MVSWLYPRKNTEKLSGACSVWRSSNYLCGRGRVHLSTYCTYLFFFLMCLGPSWEISLSLISDVIVILLMSKTCEKQWYEKAVKAKQTAGMRSRRKPVKLGDRGQLSQIHITKRSYKSSWGGVSVDPEKINPSLTIQGHQHGTHGGQSLSNNNKQQGQNLHPSFKGRYSTSYMEEHNLSI